MKDDIYGLFGNTSKFEWKPIKIVTKIMLVAKKTQYCKNVTSPQTDLYLMQM